MRAKRPYHKRRPPKEQIELLCGEVWPDDGVDPRDDRREPPAGPGRKVLQLCRQVQRALEGALAGEIRDPVLQETQVLSVTPAPNAGRLLVTLHLPPSVVADEALGRLERAAGKLRCEMAAAIHRKRTPDLAFCLVSGL